MSATPGFVSRSLAFVIDILVIAVACMFATGSIAWTGEFFRLGTFAIGHGVVNLASRLAVVSIIALYLPVSWTLTGQSVGKALLGLRVVRADESASAVRLSLSRSLLRFVGYWLSAIPLGLGFWWVMLAKNHRALHDRVAGTKVVYQPRPRPGRP